MTRRVVIVQARMTSSRLPGKVMMRLAGKTVLRHVLERCEAISGIDQVCCAVPFGEEQEVVAKEARAAGAVVVRGSEKDVLDRYHAAAIATEADVVMRVTSDCPLIDPTICSDVLAALDPGIDYVSNNFTHGFPHGLDCEAFTRDQLERCWREAHEPHDREHVTPWMRRHPSVRRRSVDGPGGQYGTWRLTLDYPEDFEFIQAVFARLSDRDRLPNWLDVARVIEAEPSLLQVNAQHSQR